MTTMIVIPCSLFELDWEGQVLRRRPSSPSNHGRVDVDVLCLWRDSPSGMQYFTSLSEQEIAVLDYELQFLPNHAVQVLKDAHLDKLSQFIGISADTGEFSRNSLLWNQMGNMDDSEIPIVRRMNDGRIGTNQQSDRQDIFLRSALRLMNERHQQEVQETDPYRRAYYRTFPAYNETIMFGLLRKRNKNLGWKERFVALAPGKMFYVEKISSSSSSGGSGGASLPGSSSSSQMPPAGFSVGTPKVIPLVPGKTWCRPASESAGSGSGGPSSLMWNQSKYDGERVFELLVTDDDVTPQPTPTSSSSSSFAMVSSAGGIMSTPLLTSQSVMGGSQSSIRSSSDVNVTKYYWACDSKEDRDRWVHLIQAASSLSSSGNELNEVRLSAHRQRVQRVESVEQHLNLLQEMENKEIRVPVDWIQRELNRPRGELDASMEQAAKDTARDAVIVNGVSVFPCSASSVMGTIAGQVLHSIHSKSIAEDEILAFSKLVFLATNRTQSGGLMWEATNLIVAAPHGTVLIPNNPEKVFPIEVFVEKASSSSSISPANENLHLFPQPQQPASISPPPSLLLDSSAPSETPEPHHPASVKGSSSGGLKRRFHRRTASDPQFFLKFLGGGGNTSTSSSSSTPNSNTTSMTTSGTSSAAAALPAAPPPAGSVATTVFPPPIADQSSGRTHPTSPKNSLKRGLSMRRKTVESEGLTAATSYEEHIKVRIHVRVRMEFNLLDENTLGYNHIPSTESDVTAPTTTASTTPRHTPTGQTSSNQNPRLALVKTVYSRTFCLVEGRSFALDQGTIGLLVSEVARSVPMLEEFVAVSAPPIATPPSHQTSADFDDEEAIVVSKDSLKDIVVETNSGGGVLERDDDDADDDGGEEEEVVSVGIGHDDQCNFLEEDSRATLVMEEDDEDDESQEDEKD